MNEDFSREEVYEYFSLISKGLRPIISAAKEDLKGLDEFEAILEKLERCKDDL